MKQKLLSILLVTIMVFALSGCVRIEEAISVSSDDKITVTAKTGYEKKATDELLEEMIQEDMATMGEVTGSYDEITNLPVETIDGVEYYVTEDSETYTAADFAKTYPEMIVNKDKFYTYADSNELSSGDLTAEDMEMMKEYISYIGIKVSLPSAIVKTNGTKENDTTASWSFTLDTLDKSYELYAYTANDAGNPDADRAIVQAQVNAAVPTPTANPTQTQTPPTTTNPAPGASKDKKAPVIKGVKKNKAYKKKATVYVKDNVKVKKVTVNGKKVKLKKVKSGKYKGYYKFTVKKKGKKKIVAIDSSGNKKKMTIKIK